MDAKEIRQVLEEKNIRPSRQLGQNFLTDANIARWIVDQLELVPEDCVVEVGPGTGALTEHIVGRCKKLILIEFDARLAEFHRERWHGFSNVEVHHADGARWNPKQLFQYQPVKFIGNLPYSAGGAIIKNFLSRPSPICCAVLMLQKEFIDRIVASVNSDAYGILSLRIQAEWNVDMLRTIPPDVFLPKPQVDSSIICLTPLENPPIYHYQFFDELVRRGFAQRRKQLKGQLPLTPEKSWPLIAEELGVSVTARAEELSLNQWIALTNILDRHPLKNTAQNLDEILDVVDNQDNVLRQETRATVHQNDLIHRAVHVLVINKRGFVLLQRRSRLKDKHPGVWDTSAAGHVSAGDSYEQTALRELGEELGILVSMEAVDSESMPRKIGQLVPTKDNGWEHIAVFIVKHSGSICFPASEIEVTDWFSPKEISDWLSARPQDFAPGFQMIWHKFSSQIVGCQKTIE